MYRIIFLYSSERSILLQSMIGIRILDSGIMEDKLYVLSNAVAAPTLYSEMQDVVVTVAAT